MNKIGLITLGIISTFVSTARPQEAQQVLDGSGVQGGLVVVIGCNNPALLAQLRAGDAYLVHGLDRDAGRVARARAYLQDRDLYGPVTVARWNGSQLPYVDNLVNLIVVTGDAGRVWQNELDRVLAPLGVICDARGASPKTSRKDWPQELDEWTHYLYDSSNNAVSGDTIVAPPNGLRWTCGPEYARSHEHFGSVSAMVTTAGRVFYIIDEGPIRSVFLPPQWKLVARDAFSGVLLWQRPVSNWESPLRGFRSGPPEIGRRLIADGQQVQVSLGYGEPVTVLDAATGNTCRVLRGTEAVRELLSHDGVLYVLADDMTAEDHEQRKQWIEGTARKLTGYRFPNEPISMYGRQRLLALDVETGKPLWSKQFGAAGEILPATLGVADGRVCLQTVSHVVCLDAGTGQEVWRGKRPVARSRFSWSTPTLVIHDGVVLTVDREADASADNQEPPQGSKWLMDNSHQVKKQDAELVAFRLDDGQKLWQAPCFENYDTQLDVFVIDGVVWVGELRHNRDIGFTQGLDLQTGKVVAKLPNNDTLYSIQMGHHRCYRNKATVRYLLLGRDGIEFVDPKRGTGDGNWWVRGTCQYGIMPANGLVYAPQHSCACHPAEKLIGFNALSPLSSASDESVDDLPPLEKGPAYGDRGNSTVETLSGGDWTTYRRQANRSGFQDLPAPRNLSTAWRQKFAAPVTAPVVTGDAVFFAEEDRHSLYSLSARDGTKRWKFVADGRIDSPPTVWGGFCLFGTRNGFVYCLRAADGERVWRFRAAPRQKLLFAYEQLESAWPVHGSVLIDAERPDRSPLVYFAAGRSSHLDGGIHIYGLELTTGQVRHQALVSMTADAEDGQGVIQRRALPDVLSLQNGSIFMRDLRLTKNLAVANAKLPHLYAPGGFLDDTWWHRTYWMYGTQMMSGYGGWPIIGNYVPAGRLLAMDGGNSIFGYARMAYRAGAGHVQPDEAKDYRLFAEVFKPQKDPLQDAQRRKSKPKQKPDPREILWSTSLPFVANSIVLTPDALLVAGGQSDTTAGNSPRRGTLWVASRTDGTKQAECQLPAAPILDGLAFAEAGVFASTKDGSIICVREAP